MNAPKTSVSLDEFERRVLNTENPLTAALDYFYGKGEWDELQADRMGETILVAIEVVREDVEAERA